MRTQSLCSAATKALLPALAALLLAGGWKSLISSTTVEAKRGNICTELEKLLDRDYTTIILSINVAGDGYEIKGYRHDR